MVIIALTIDFGESKYVINQSAEATITFNRLNYEIIPEVEEGEILVSDYAYTLMQAIEKAPEGASTIKVLVGITEITEVTVPENKSIVLDLNGKTTTFNGVSIINKGTLDIYSSEENGILYSSSSSSIDNKGIFTTNGTSNKNEISIINTSTDDYVELLRTDSEATLNSNTTLKIQNISTNTENTRNRSIVINRGIVIVNGANLINNIDGPGSELGIANASDTNTSRIIINEGTNIETYNVAVSNRASTQNGDTPAIKITGGTIKSINGDAILSSGGTVEIGDNTNAVITASPTIIGNQYGVLATSSSEIKFYDGTITGSTGKSINGSVTGKSEGYRINKKYKDDTETSFLVQGNELTVTYDYQTNQLYEAGEYSNTGFTIDWCKNFTIEETINIPELGKRYLLIGNYGDRGTGDTNAFNLEIYNNNSLRIYFGTNSVYFDRKEGEVYAKEDINVIFSWDAQNQKYEIKAKGTNTNIEYSGTHSMSGTSINPLRIGTSDYRGSEPPFTNSNITVKSLKISTTNTINTNLTNIPTPEREGATFEGWYTEQTSGTQVNTSTLLEEADVVYYAQWVGTVIYDYNLSKTFAENKFMDTGYIINWDEDFTIEETVNIPADGQRHLLIGGFGTNSRRELNLEVFIDNTLRVYFGTGQKDEYTTEKVSTENDVDIVFNWNAATHTYTITAEGDGTVISMTNIYEISGLAVNTLRIGTMDYRSSASPFKEITVKNLKITKQNKLNQNLIFVPNVNNDDEIFNGWYAKKGEETHVSTNTIVKNSKETYYAQWRNYAGYDENDNLKNYYCTLKEAFEKAESGNTIKPIVNNLIDKSADVINLGSETETSKSLKFDLRGYTVTLDKQIMNYGTLDIYSSEDEGILYSSNNESIFNNGTFTTNGTNKSKTLSIINTSTEDYVELIRNDGTATLNDKTTLKLQNAANNSSSTKNRYVVINRGTATIDGATLINKAGETIREQGISNASTPLGGKIIVKSGSIETTGYAIMNLGGTGNSTSVPAIKITGGTITSTGANAIYNSREDSMLYIAKEDGMAPPQIYTTSKTSAAAIDSKGSFTMETGEIIGYSGMAVYLRGSNSTALISGGTITKAQNPDNTVGNAGAGWFGGACFQYEGTKTATITGDAVIQNNLGNSSNVIFNAGTGTMEIGGSAKVQNLGAVQVGGNFSKGKVIVKDNAEITSNGGIVLINDNRGSVATSTSYPIIEIEGKARLSTSGQRAISNNCEYGQIIVTGGTLTADGTSSSYGTIYNNAENAVINVSGGEIKRTNYPIYNAMSGTNTTITITGGKVTATEENAIYNHGTDATVTIGTANATSNEAPAITGRIWGDSTNVGDITINSGTITSTTGRAIESNGNITINGGNISSTISVGPVSLSENPNALLKVTGGTIESKDQGYAITTTNTEGKSGTVEITGGTIIKSGTSGTGAAVNNQYGTTTITGGTIENKGGPGVYTNKGIIKVTGGTITGDSYGVCAYQGIIELGTNETTPLVSTAVPSITGKTYGVQLTLGTFNFYDGVIKGKNGEGSSCSREPDNMPSGYTRKITYDSATSTETSTLKKTYTKITYDMNARVRTYDSGKYLDTGIIIDWDKDFTIETTVNISELGKRYLVVGNYNASDTQALNIEINTDNKLRIFIGKSGKEKISDESVNANENIKVIFNWKTATNTYTVTAVGTKTNIELKAVFTAGELRGTSANGLRAGTVDHRGSSVFNKIRVIGVKISKPYTYPSTIGTLPVTTMTDFTFNGWHTAASSGLQINSNTEIPAAETTYYAHWDSNVFKVNLNQNGGAGGTTTIYEKYYVGWFSDEQCTNAITSITIPTKPGYVFGGYFTNEASETVWIDLTGKIVLGSASTSINNTTLIAKWTKITSPDGVGNEMSLMSMSKDMNVLDNQKNNFEEEKNNEHTSISKESNMESSKDNEVIKEGSSQQEAE